ncbi:MAG: DODA-type extradiol aromatic ring-opening family dioxygenase [Acidiferrobacterales bacterium]
MTVASSGLITSVFVSHGAPTLLLEAGPTQTFLTELGRTLPRPRAILCVSAHWDTPAPRITGNPAPATIHDFYGFPDALYEVRYPSPGEPQLAEQVAVLLRGVGLDAAIDPSRGLDHGAWVPLHFMYPQADIPVVQLSLQSHLDPQHHLSIGRALQALRADRILIIGSGGATHNLGEFGVHTVDAPAQGYAQAFDNWLEDAVLHARSDTLLDYVQEGPSARRNHPTAEHFLPLFVPMGAASADTRGRRLHAGFTYGVLSMAAYAWD